MAKKKYKVKIWNNVEISVTDINDLKPLTVALTKAGTWEREQKHLSIAESYYRIHDEIGRQIKEQIND